MDTVAASAHLRGLLLPCRFYPPPPSTACARSPPLIKRHMVTLSSRVQEGILELFEVVEAALLEKHEREGRERLAQLLLQVNGSSQHSCACSRAAQHCVDAELCAVPDPPMSPQVVKCSMHEFKCSSVQCTHASCSQDCTISCPTAARWRPRQGHAHPPGVPVRRIHLRMHTGAGDAQNTSSHVLPAPLLPPGRRSFGLLRLLDWLLVRCDARHLLTPTHVRQPVSAAHVTTPCSVPKTSSPHSML